MIALKELNPHNYATTPKQAENLALLLEKLNAVRASFGKPMIVTSGLRSAEDMRRIYANMPKIPWGSQHVQGAAADISDLTGELAGWVKDNVPLLEKLGLWIEDLTVTKTVAGKHGWVHFQIVAPKSGQRFFKP